MRILVYILILVTLAIATPAHAQVLQQQHWTNRAQQRIQEIRTVPVRIIVLDADDNPVPNVPVRLRMLEHAFPFGVHLTPDPTTHELPDGFIEAAIERGQGPIIWRCFNAINLESISDWPTLQPEPVPAWDFSRIDQLLSITDAYGLGVRFGKIIPSDPGHLPNWAAKLQPLSLTGATRTHVERIARTFARRVDAFDVYGFDRNHHLIDDKIRNPMLRTIYQRAKAAAPRADMMLRFESDLAGRDLAYMLRTVTTMREAFIPFDGVTLKTTFRGQVLQRPLEQALDLIHQLDIPVYISPLEIAGPTDHAAALNLETVLITLFSHPAVQGIDMADPLPDRASDPNSALFDNAGDPTPAGKIFDKLIRERWWTDITLRTNNLGETRTRVFAGNYEIITAMHPPTSAHTPPTTPTPASPDTPSATNSANPSPIIANTRIHLPPAPPQKNIPTLSRPSTKKSTPPNPNPTPEHIIIIQPLTP